LQAARKVVSIAGAVVSHHALDTDGELGVIGNGGLQEGDGTLFALIGHDLHEGDARGIVDADMNVLPTDAEVAIDHQTTVRYDSISA
jgi:hypothetical protein